MSDESFILGQRIFLDGIISLTLIPLNPYISFIIINFLIFQAKKMKNNFLMQLLYTFNSRTFHLHLQFQCDLYFFALGNEGNCLHIFHTIYIDR